MQHKAISLRPFIGAKDFEISRSFYRDLGFEEVVLDANMSVFKTGQLAFYLQNAYVKDWVDNTMLFLEVDDVARYWNELLALDLPAKYAGVRLTPIRVDNGVGNVFYMTPPESSGILVNFLTSLNSFLWPKAGNYGPTTSQFRAKLSVIFDTLDRCIRTRIKYLLVANDVKNQ